jgi:hypothetical protein
LLYQKEGLNTNNVTHVESQKLSSKLVEGDVGGVLMQISSHRSELDVSNRQINPEKNKQTSSQSSATWTACPNC